jgi:hypothetical protein
MSRSIEATKTGTELLGKIAESLYKSTPEPSGYVPPCTTETTTVTVVVADGKTTVTVVSTPERQNNG